MATHWPVRFKSPVRLVAVCRICPLFYLSQERSCSQSCFKRVQEWIEDYKEHDPNHRHTSHLYGLHPGRQITKNATPDHQERDSRSLRRGKEVFGGAWGRRQRLEYGVEGQFLGAFSRRGPCLQAATESAQEDDFEQPF